MRAEAFGEGPDDLGISVDDGDPKREPRAAQAATRLQITRRAPTAAESSWRIRRTLPPRQRRNRLLLQRRLVPPLALLEGRRGRARR